MPTPDNNMPPLPSPCTDDDNQYPPETHPNNFTHNDEHPCSPGDLDPAQELHILQSDLLGLWACPPILSNSLPKQSSFAEQNSIININKPTAVAKWSRERRSYMNKCIRVQKFFGSLLMICFTAKSQTTYFSIGRLLLPPGKTCGLISFFGIHHPFPLTLMIQGCNLL